MASRKFILVTVILIAGTIAMFCNYTQFKSWSQFALILYATYSGANLTSKIITSKDVTSKDKE